MFVVKDGLGTYLRDVVSSLDSAENAYTEREYRDELQSELDAIYAQVTGLRRHKFVCKPLTTDDLQPQDLKGIALDLLREKEANNQLVGHLKVLAANLSEKSQKAIRTIETSRNDALMVSARPQALITTGMEICKERDSLLRLKYQLFSDAGKTIQDYTRYSEIANHLSTLLYILGWAISFIGAVGGAAGVEPT
jgi:hypothetical protein